MQQPAPPKLTEFEGLEEALGVSKQKEKETGKPHPVFSVDEVVELKGGRFRIHAIKKNRLILKPIKY